MTAEKLKGRAIGGAARMAKLTPEERKENAKKAALIKAENTKLPAVTHSGTIKLGSVEIPCYVTQDGMRLVSGRGMQVALKLVSDDFTSANRAPGTRFTEFLANKTINSLIFKDKSVDEFLPIKAKFNGSVIHGYRAEVLADVCESMLDARRAGLIKTERFLRIADQCEVLIRGFARVGIAALVDEATGFQKDRAKDALAKILEAYVAKELQPWVKTFDSDFYEQMFRLRGLPYPPSNPNFRPRYFGLLTNDIVYRRLAPGVLDALKQENAKAEKKGKLHQHLTAGYGRQSLLKHLGKTQALMEVSENWPDFMAKMNKVAPRHGDTIPMELEEPDR